MKNLILILTTPAGDELTRRPVPGVAIADANDVDGEPDTTSTRKSMVEELERLYSAVEQAVLESGVELAAEKLDWQIEVSGALLKGSDEDIVVTLPVREVAQLAPPKDGTDAVPTVAWDDLFTLEPVVEGHHENLG